MLGSEEDVGVRVEPLLVVETVVEIMFELPPRVVVTVFMGVEVVVKETDPIGVEVTVEVATTVAVAVAVIVVIGAVAVTAGVELEVVTGKSVT